MFIDNTYGIYLSAEILPENNTISTFMTAVQKHKGGKHELPGISLRQSPPGCTQTTFTGEIPA
ncbi:TPA: hypothetical protein PC598_000747 [Morganella morganii]|nr:hypothetical protein [Morganella morganii]